MAWVLILQGMDKIKKDLTNPLYSLPPPDFSFACGGEERRGEVALHPAKRHNFNV